MSILFFVISGLMFVTATLWLHTIIINTLSKRNSDKGLVPLMFIASGIFAIAGVLA